MPHSYPLTRREFLRLALLTGGGLLAAGASAPAAPTAVNELPMATLPVPTRPYLILYDWAPEGTTRTPDFIANNADFIDTLPFDGLDVWLGDLSLQVMDAKPLAYDTIAAALKPMKDKKLKNVTQNFAVVSSPEDALPDFFDDWTTPIQNFANVARAARDAGLVGIAFDNEDYSSNWSTYPDNCKYAATKTLADYQDQMRARGKEIMAAMIAEFPAIAVVSFYGPYVSEPSTPLLLGSGDSSDLHGPLFAGFVEAAQGTAAKVVDGGELYDLRTNTDFETAFQFRKYGIASPEINCAFIPKSLRQSWSSSVGIGFGLYDCVNDGQNYPLLDVAVVRSNITNALRHSDSYVWFFNERIDFLKPASAGGAPAAWVDAVRKGKADGLAGWKLFLPLILGNSR
ncbi:MAG: hypothetical protein KGJ80_05640 [Chloroflexota bacterium]|nr:hypothetical protein [Chloroflexota bacterium]